MSSEGNTKKVLKGYPEEELVYNSYEDLIEILQNDCSEIPRKLSCVDILFNKFVKPPEGGPLQSKILEEVMPFVKKLIDSVFEKTVELSLDNQHEKCISTLEIIRENLDMVIELLDILDNLLLFVINKNKVNFSFIQNLPLCIGNILYATFLHCKESNNIYLIYFDSISEILLIFKKAQEVHVKLLKALESHILINISNPEELSLLKDVLDSLLSIGILLSGMNVKSMADNWKGYTNLTQKYNDALAKEIDLKRPLELLTNEILANLKGTFEMDMEDVKTVTYTLKIGNFIIKVMLKLCFTFWDNVRSNFDVLWNFLISLYSHSTKSSKQIRCPEQILNLIKSFIVDPIDSLVERLSTEEKFCRLGEIKPGSPLCSYGYVLFINRVFYYWICKLSECPIDQYQLNVHLENIICCFKENHDSILREENYYKDLMVQLPLLALKLNSTGFYTIEEILCKHLFNDSIFVTVFVQDIWVVLVRLTDMNYAYDVLCNLVDKSKLLINTKFSNDVPVRKLSNFLRNVFFVLNDDYKTKFLLQYPISKNLSLWKRLGISELPKSARRDTEALLIDTVRHIEQFLYQKCTLEQFFVMVDLLIVTSTLRFEETYFDASKLSSLVLQLWAFEYNEDLMDSPFFDLLLEGMLKITCSLTWKFSNEQMAQIADTLKLVTKSNDISRILSLSLFVNKEGGIRSEDTNNLFENLGEITHNLLTINNVILKNAAFQLMGRNLKHPLRDPFLQYITKKIPKYQTFVTSTIIYRPVDTAKITNALKSLNYTPSHKCLEWSLQPKTKRIKVDEKAEISKALSKLEADVEDLKELLKTEDLKGEHVATISTVILTLHSCLK